MAIAPPAPQKPRRGGPPLAWGQRVKRAQPQVPAHNISRRALSEAQPGRQELHTSNHIHGVAPPPPHKPHRGSTPLAWGQRVPRAQPQVACKQHLAPSLSEAQPARQELHTCNHIHGVAPPAPQKPQRGGPPLAWGQRVERAQPQVTRQTHAPSLSEAHPGRF